MQQYALIQLTVILFVWSTGGFKLCSLVVSVNLMLLGRLASGNRERGREHKEGREGGREGTSKGELLLVVMAAGKCTMGSCVSKVKRDARALLVSLRQTTSLTCS